MNKKTLIITITSVIAVLALVVALLLVWRNFGQTAEEGLKTVTIEIVNKSGVSQSVTLETEALYLRQAMEEAGVEFRAVDGMIMVLNGQQADYTVDQSYWAIYVNGEYANYGIDTQPVSGGDAYRFVYTIG